MFFGLPDRIRTYDLQSRSLTRYPAVPRVDDSGILSQEFEKVNGYGKKSLEKDTPDKKGIDKRGGTKV